MRCKFYGLFLLTLFVSFSVVPDRVRAQPVSVGFSAPDSTQPIEAYRLPDWRSSVWELRFNGGGDVTRRDLDDTDGTQYRTAADVDLRIQPSYDVFWESEARTVSVLLQPVIDFQARSLSVEDTDDDESSRRIEFGVSANGLLREYVSDETFLFGSMNTSTGFLDGVVNRDDPDVRDIDRYRFFGSYQARTGIGFGRVRDVTPVVRALRVRERLRALDANVSLSSADVQAAARQLAREPSYNAVYDRRDKYFWRDFFESAGVSGGLSPFDVFYVADVLREPLGRRLEGAEISVGPQANYRNELNREDSDPGELDRDRTIESEVGGFVHARWYHNVSLRHQLGLVVDNTYRRTLQTESELDHRLDLGGEFQWLWIVADRIQLDTRAEAEFFFTDSPVVETSDFDLSVSRYRAQSNLTVFVENRLAITAGGSVDYVRRGTDGPVDGATSEVDVSVDVGISYFLSRTIR